MRVCPLQATNKHTCGSARLRVGGVRCGRAIRTRTSWSESKGVVRVYLARRITTAGGGGSNRSSMGTKRGCLSAALYRCQLSSHERLRRCTPPPTAPSLSRSLPPSHFFLSQKRINATAYLPTFRLARLLRNSNRTSSWTWAPCHPVYLYKAACLDDAQWKYDDTATDIITQLAVVSRFWGFSLDYSWKLAVMR